MKSTPYSILARNILLALLLVLFCTLIAASAHSQSPAAASFSQAKTFDTPQQAVAALIEAAANYDVGGLMVIFGPDSKDFISSADPVRDQSYAKEFANKAQEKNEVIIDPSNKSRATLSVGNDGWPFPVPLVKSGIKWHFDAKQGHDEIVYRRIGANELDA